jgi:phasin family protein
MFTNFDDIQKFSKDRMEYATKAAAHFSKSVQQLAAENADYSKKSLQLGTSALEQLLAAKSIDRAFEIQTDFAKNAYEGFVAQATRMGELVTNMTRDAWKPLEQATAPANV